MCHKTGPRCNTRRAPSVRAAPRMCLSVLFPEALVLRFVRLYGLKHGSERFCTAGVPIGDRATAVLATKPMLKRPSRAGKVPPTWLKNSALCLLDESGSGNRQMSMVGGKPWTTLNVEPH